MKPADQSSGNLLINGAFLPELWTRLGDAADEGVACPVDRETFAADRWSVRYAAPEGAEIRQARSRVTQPRQALATSDTSLEIRGQAGVTQPVILGQKIEASEASGYLTELTFEAWFLAIHPTLSECPVRFTAGFARERDVFDKLVFIGQEDQGLPMGEWKQLRFFVDGGAAGPSGLSVELELSPEFLGHAEARFYIADAVLADAARARPARRPVALETLLARRFCQRHSAQTLNAIGRSLVCNAHELHFQLLFPEMRGFPTVTVPQSNEELTVFSPDGIPQEGFVYDVSYRSRGSAIIRATKWNHGLSDGFLAFRGYEGSILLEAEL